MESFKKKMLAIALMLVLALVVAACGGSSDDDTLEGTFVVEGDEASGEQITFSGDNFTFEAPYSAMELGFDVPGRFVLTGTFTVDDSAQTVSLRVNDDALREAVVELVDALMDYMIEDDPDLAAAMEDPDIAAMMDEVMEGMLDEVLRELRSLFNNFDFTFDGNFNRLYHDDAVYVRR